MTPISAEEVLSFKALNDVQFSADGNYLSYVIADPYRIKGEESERSSVWVHDFREKITFCASAGLLQAFYPRFSGDGRNIAFIGRTDQSSKPQLHLFNITSGGMLQITNLDGDIEQFEWSPGNEALFVLMKEGSGMTADPEEFEEETVFSSLYTLELQSGALHKISDGYQIWEFAVSPDSKHVIALTSDEPYEWCWHIARITLIDLQKKESRAVFDPRPRQVGSMKWSEDGKSVYFISSIISDRGLTGGDLFRFSPFSESRPVNLTNSELGTVHFYDFSAESKLLVLSVNMSRVVFSLLDTSNGHQETVSLGSFDFWINPRFQPRFSYSRAAASMAVVREDPASQQEIWTGRLTGNAISWNRQTYLNGSQAEKMPGECRLVEWKSFDGTTIQGFVYYLTDSGKQRPLIVNIHGGPSMCYGFSFSQQARFFLSRGFNVFQPNPRGSTGRGPLFSELNRGNTDGKDFDDILAGIDHLTKNGLADPSNLFVMGGSYGGYLVAWAITHSSIFNGAVMNFGISNLLSCHGTEWNIYWDEFLFNIDPYREPEKYHRKSPIDYVINAKTPTLILHGKEDPCVPVGQGRELFRALKELGVETRLVVYPRERHGWTEKDHITDALQRQADWFTRHMKSSNNGS